MAKEKRLTLAQFLQAHKGIVNREVDGVSFGQDESGIYVLTFLPNLEARIKERSYRINESGEIVKDERDYPEAFLDAYLHKLATRVYNVLVQDIAKVDPIVRSNEV